MQALRKWLRTSDGQLVIDDAVLGALMQADVDELCEMFGVSETGVHDAIADAINEGY